MNAGLYHLGKKSVYQFIAGCSLIMLLVPSSPAEEQPPVSPVKDFGAGVKKFEAFGLPDVRGGEYSKLQFYNDRPDSFLFLGEYQEPRLRGNAWNMSTNGQDTALFINGGLNFEVTAYKHSANTSDTTNAPDGYMGSWNKTTLEKDVATLQKWLAEEPEEHDWYFESQQGQMFLFALHVYQAGLTNEANLLIQHIMDRADKPREVITGGLQQLAEQRYERACEDFYKTQDWAQLESSLAELLRVFKTSWEDAPGVIILLERIQMRTNIQAVVKLEGLTDEQHQMYTNLLQSKSIQRFWDQRPFWQFGSTYKEPKAHIRSTLPTNHPLIQIRNQGMAALPMLLVMLDDDTLIPISTSDLPNHSRYSSSIQTPEDIFQQRINRPAMVSDIARAMLSPIQVIENRWQSNRLSTEEIRDGSLDFYERYKEKTPMDIALDYIAEGNDDQKQQSLQWLIYNMQSNDYTRIESLLMEEMANDYEQKELVRQYVRIRGADATNFVEQYIVWMQKEGLPDEVMDFGDDGEAEEQLQRQQAQFIKQLRNLVSQKPLDELFDDIATGKASLNDNSYIIQTRMADIPVDERIGMILDTAIQTTNESTRIEVLTLLQGQTRFSNAYYTENENEAEPLDFETHATKWKQLFEQIPDEPETQLLIANACEALYGNHQESPWETYHLSISLKHLGAADLLITRMKDRLAGKSNEELTALPSADNISDDEVDALIEKLRAMDDDALQNALMNLSMDQALALNQAAEENPDLRDEFQQRTFFITTITTYPASIEASTITALKGKKINRALIEQINDLVQSNALEGDFSNAYIGRINPFAGFTITHTRQDPAVFSEEQMSSMVPHVPREFKSTGYIYRFMRTDEDYVTSITALNPSTQMQATDAPSAEINADEMDLLDEVMSDLESEEERDFENTLNEFNDTFETVFAPDASPKEFLQYSILAIPAPQEEKENLHD